MRYERIPLRPLKDTGLLSLKRDPGSDHLLANSIAQFRTSERSNQIVQLRLACHRARRCLTSCQSPLIRRIVGLVNAGMKFIRWVTLCVVGVGGSPLGLALDV